jgi:Domain of unknown function (DUF4139)
MRWSTIGLWAVMAMLSVPEAMAGELALKRVMLSSGGVAYLEYEAEITGNTELPLDVPLDQVDDVLKSIVVFDDKGGVGSASLPGRQPLEQSFRDLPFDQKALNSPADLLSALQGAEITVGGNRPLTGKLLSAVPEMLTAGPNQAVTQHRVTLLTSAGLQQFVLEQADGLRFVDPALQAMVDKALTEIAANRGKDRRRLVLTTQGTGKRIVRVGYVVGAPLWKTSFRLVMPEDQDATTAHLQGWAVLENMSGADWQDVELTLLSGNPVSFRQAIYETYYVNRPEVPVDVVGHVLPPKDVAQEQASALSGSGATRDFKAEGLRLRGHGNEPLPPPMTAAEPASLAQSVNTAQASEAATQVAYRVPVPVSVASGHSAMIPIIDRNVPAERVALYRQATLSTHPLASLRLKNDQPNGLPPGVVTLYEHGAEAVSYVGDAQLAALPPGESRLISYAADEKTEVSVSTDQTDAVAHASIAAGLLRLTRLYRASTTYHMKAPSAEPRRLLIEQDKVPGYRLVSPTGTDITETPDSYRFPLALKPGESADLVIKFEWPIEESKQILDFDDDRIGALVEDRELDPKIRAAFTELARLRHTVGDKRAALADLDQQLKTLDQEQLRIRQNLSSADRDSDLHKRYMAKLADQETQIEKLQGTRTKAEGERQAAEDAVKAYLVTLSL